MTATTAAASTRGVRWTRTLRAFVVADLRLYLREPILAVFAFGVPTMLMLGLGLPSFAHHGDPTLGGRRMIDAVLPSLVLSLSLLLIGLFGLPMAVASGRELGMLRRLATTPASPVTLLLSQLIVNVLSALVATALLLTVGWGIVGVPLPASGFALAAALLLGLTSVLGLGLVIAAVAPSPRAANPLAQLVVQPCSFLGGLYVPSYLLPDAIADVGRATPVGALRAAIETAQLGSGPLLAPLAILAAWSVGSVVVASRTFRWQ